jgi:hypothetical protein
MVAEFFSIALLCLKSKKKSPIYKKKIKKKKKNREII